MFDCIIIGAGVIGASLARELSKYNLKVKVIEKNNDVGDETSCANSAIIHSGYDPHAGTLKAKYNVLGNQMFDELCNDLDVEFKRIGSITVATNEEEVEILKNLLENSKLNGVDVKLLDQEELFKVEPFVTKKALKGLLAETAGIINPFELVVKLMENAIDNGVELSLSEKVIGIEKIGDGYKVITDKASYETRCVVNAAGVNSDDVNNMINPEKEKIMPRKGEYFVLDHFSNPYVTHTLFSVPSSKGKGVLVSPTTHGNYILGPTSEFGDDKEDKSVDGDSLNNIIKECYRLVDNLPLDQVIREFSGVRSYHESNDFVINEPTPGFINLLGIQSPGLSSAPAIAEEVVNMLSNVIELNKKANFNPKNKKHIKMADLNDEEKQALIKQNADYGKIICRCESISLGEIKDVINRSCGAKTIKGVKKRCRPGFGKCQGGFCESIVLKILADELKVNPTSIMKSNVGSYIIFDNNGGEDNE